MEYFILICVVVSVAFILMFACAKVALKIANRTIRIGGEEDRPDYDLLNPPEDPMKSSTDAYVDRQSYC